MSHHKQMSSGSQHYEAERCFESCDIIFAPSVTYEDTAHLSTGHFEF